MTLAKAIETRGIEEVLHFTTNHGVLGMFAVGAILPRKRLAEEEYLEHVYEFNSKERKDPAYLDHVSASISRVNTRFFAISQHWHRDAETWWAIVALDPVVLLQPGVVFATTNNIYPQCRRGEGQAGFEALFADPVAGRYTDVHHRGEDHPDAWTTHVEAEILYPGPISSAHVRCVYVVNDDHADLVAAHYDILDKRGDSADERTELPISVRPELFF